jgi:uric acid-xanthine permease
MNAITLVMETGFAVTAFLALFLNLFIPEEVDDEVVDVNGLPADAVPNPTAVAGGSAIADKGQTTAETSSSRSDSVDKIDAAGKERSA